MCRAPVHRARPPQVWKLRRFAGGAEHALRADVTLVSTTKEAKPWVRPPISMSFQVGGARVCDSVGVLKVAAARQGGLPGAAT